ncbi:hypothetical protein [uncultured Tateyamaria sp.]|uniref:hypothetical protein n=1 Tax=uncultured Tateyamaria sp. TaxID=455651 RepID=UPI00261233BD|nr:hypothetical protein [uncultured Tateyamaria sp.]
MSHRPETVRTLQEAAQAIMTKLFIHIGAHKTGTTTLQRCFDENSAALAALGVTYPRSNWFHHSQHRLAFALKGMRDPLQKDIPDFDREVGALNTAVASAKTSNVFISSEEFFSCSADAVMRLKDRLDVDSTHIIATVRRPDTMFVSMYNQKAKQPNNGFNRLITSFVDKPETLDSDLSFWSCIRNWRDTFSCDMTLLQYETGPAVDQMLGVLGLEPDALPQSTAINKSLPGAVIEVMRLSKATGLSPHAQKQVFWLANQVLADRPSYFLSAENRRKILRSVEAENHALFAAFGMKNPYTIDSRIADLPEDSERQNIAFRDLMLMLGTLLDQQTA